MRTGGMGSWASLILMLCACNPSDLWDELSNERSWKSLESQPDWLFPADDCPADVAPSFGGTIRFSVETCEEDVAACLSRCELGDGAACFEAALAAQNIEESGYAEALFLRGCGLGVAASCTNRAAGMLNDDPDNPEVLACTLRTVQMMCDLDEAWGCSMLGLSLMEGAGVAPDIEGAMSAFERACAGDEAHPACLQSRDFLEQMAEPSSGS